MRPVEDALAECLRRWRHGLIRPLWEHASEETHNAWRSEAGVLIRMLDGFGLAVVQKPGAAK